MTFETERLILRQWQLSDAEVLYELAKDIRVGPAAGWPIHTSIQNSRDIINNVLSKNETYAVVLKESYKPVGSIGLMFGNDSNIKLAETEAEIGYWIGVPWWGQGYIPEAVRYMQKHAFHDMKLSAIWCGYFDGNEQSKRVQEKCGFKYHHTEKDIFGALTNEIKTEHITRITQEEWITENK